MKSYLAFCAIVLILMAAEFVYAEETKSPLDSSSVFESQDRWLDQLAKPIPIYRDQVKLKMGGEFRYRLELRDNFNFNHETYEDDALSLFRSRLNFNLTAGPYFRIFAEGQDAESVASSVLDRSSAFVNRLDLRQLYTEIKSPWKEVPVSVTVGRQELSYGDERFVGAFNWSNVARVFDAAKLVFSPFDWFRLDVWFSQVVPVNRSQADSANHNDNFYGVYNSLKPFKNHVFDTFLFVRHNLNRGIVGEKPGEQGQLKEYTVGNRFKGRKGNFDYGIEWATQFGSRAHDDIQAWAWHNEIGYTLTNFSWNPRPNFEYNHGSGNHNSTDGHYGDFDNLFPTNHPFYGYMDFASLRNMNDVKVGMDLKPNSRVKFSCDYHWFFLDTNGSAWFNASQKVIRAAQLGASTTIGQELDLLGTWQLSAHLDLMMGYSHFHAGAFMKDTGAHDSADFFYTQFTVKV